MSTPIRRTRSVSCALVADGNTSAPLSATITSRRLTRTGIYPLPAELPKGTTIPRDERAYLRFGRRRDVRFGWRVQPIDATPSNLARGGGVRWRGLHGYGSRRSRGLSFGSAGRTVNVWRISRGRLREGTRAVSIVSWLSMVALLRSRAGELRER